MAGSNPNERIELVQNEVPLDMGGPPRMFLGLSWEGSWDVCGGIFVGVVFAVFFGGYVYFCKASLRPCWAGVGRMSVLGTSGWLSWSMSLVRGTSFEDVCVDVSLGCFGVSFAVKGILALKMSMPLGVTLGMSLRMPLRILGGVFQMFQGKSSEGVLGECLWGCLGGWACLARYLGILQFFQKMLVADFVVGLCLEGWLLDAFGDVCGTFVFGTCQHIFWGCRPRYLFGTSWGCLGKFLRG